MALRARKKPTPQASAKTASAPKTQPSTSAVNLTSSLTVPPSSPQGAAVSSPPLPPPSSPSSPSPPPTPAPAIPATPALAVPLASPQSEVIKVEDENSLPLAFSGAVLTAVDGALKVPDEARNLCALFENGFMACQCVASSLTRSSRPWRNRPSARGTRLMSHTT